MRLFSRLSVLLLLAGCAQEPTSNVPDPGVQDTLESGTGADTTTTGVPVSSVDDSGESTCSDADPQVTIYMPCRGCALVLDDTIPLQVRWSGEPGQAAYVHSRWGISVESTRWARRTQLHIGTELVAEMLHEHGIFSPTGEPGCELSVDDVFVFGGDRLDELTAGDFSMTFSVWPEDTAESGASILQVSPAGVVTAPL